MRIARAQEIGRGLGTIGFLLVLITSAMISPHNFGAIFPLLFFGCLIATCAGGVGQVPLRQITFTAWAGIALGLTLMGIGVMWGFIYKYPWAFLLTAGMLVASLGTMSVGLWVYERGGDN